MGSALRATDEAQLGKTPLRVTRLGLGTSPLAGLYEAVEPDVAHGVVRHALKLGIRLFDTAPLYGFGLAEQRLGQGLAGTRRDAFVVATKVGRLLEHDAPVDLSPVHGGQPLFRDAPDLNPVFNFTRDGILRSIEESLTRLGVGQIDVLHIHDPDDYFDEALSVAYPTLDELRSAGVIGAIGAGMNQASMLARFAREADFDCFLLAGRYTLLDQTGLHELLPLCEQRGISVIVGGVYNSGILADPHLKPTYNYVPAPSDLVEKARRIAKVCERHHVSLKAAAIQFPFGHPAVTSVLTGSRSVAELDENVSMVEVPIPPTLWDELRHEQLLPPEVPTPVGV